jgi:thiosulfate dehydrogenase [quinone] large subunit
MALPTDWRADTSLAYAIFRLTFGVNLMLRGVDRIFFMGLDNFGNGMVKQFSMTWLGPGLIQPFAHTIPWIEMVMGALLIVGLFTRPALVVGGLLMTALTFGTMFLRNFDLAWLQLTYAIAFFLLLATHAWNAISLDAMLGRTRPTSVRVGAGI